MCLIAAVVLCALSTVHAGLYEELTLPRGLELAKGLSLHLDPVERENGTLLERHALRLDYAGVGFSVVKASNKDALELGLFMDGEVEGRRRKVGEFLIPTLIGFKATGIAITTITAVSLLVFKAVGLANLALVASIGMMIAKYLQHLQQPTSNVEMESPSYNFPIIAENPSATGYIPSASTNYLSYANYETTGVEGADTGTQYTIVEAPTGNGSVVAVPANKRHDFHRRKSQSVPFLILRKYTIE